MILEYESRWRALPSPVFRPTTRTKKWLGRYVLRLDPDEARDWELPPNTLVAYVDSSGHADVPRVLDFIPAEESPTGIEVRRHRRYAEAYQAAKHLQRELIATAQLGRSAKERPPRAIRLRLHDFYLRALAAGSYRDRAALHAVAADLASENGATTAAIFHRNEMRHVLAADAIVRALGGQAITLERLDPRAPLRTIRYPLSLSDVFRFEMMTPANEWIVAVVDREGKVTVRLPGASGGRATLRRRARPARPGPGRAR